MVRLEPVLKLSGNLDFSCERIRLWLGFKLRPSLPVRINSAELLESCFSVVVLGLRERVTLAVEGGCLGHG